MLYHNYISVLLLPYLYVFSMYRTQYFNSLPHWFLQTFNIESDLEGIVEWRHRALRVGFEDSRYGSISISSYPTGQIGFLLCRKSVDASPSMVQVKDRYDTIVSLGKDTSYYQPKLQESAFSLPLWVERRVYEFNVTQSLV